MEGENSVSMLSLSKNEPKGSHAVNESPSGPLVNLIKHTES